MGIFHEQVEKAKVRQLTAVEALNDESQESRFSPVYFEQPEVIADNYFRLGLVGMLVSNKKTEGFSDSNLHTVINLSNHSYSDTNNPQTLIQGIGRNRGLDNTITPFYIHSLGKEAGSLFDLNNLNKDDYYPDLYKGQTKYNEIFLENISKKVSLDIILWIKEHTKDNDELDETKLKQKVLNAVSHSLRVLNKANGHKLSLSRSQLNVVIASSMKLINEEIRNLKEPYKLSGLVSFLGTIINFIFECHYSLKKLGPKIKLRFKEWFSFSSLSREDKVYIKILKNISFKDLVAKGASANEIKKLMTKTMNGVVESFKGRPDEFLKKQSLNRILSYVNSTLLPLCLALIADDKRAVVSTKLSSVSNWPQKLIELHPHLNGLSDINKITSSQIVNIFKVICPDIEIKDEDVILPAQRKDSLTKYFNDLKFITDNPKYKSSLESSITNHFEKNLLDKIRPMFNADDFIRLSEEVNRPGNLRLLVRRLLSNLSPTQIQEPKRFFIDQIKEQYEFDNLRTLDDHFSKTKLLFKKLEQFSLNPGMEEFNRKTINQVTSQIEHELLPILVTYFPYKSRWLILKNAESKDISKFVYEHGLEFLKLVESDPKRASFFIYSNLLGEQSLPFQIDEALEKERVHSILTSFKSRLESKSKLELIGQNIAALNFFNPITNSHYAAVPEVANFLESEDFDYLTEFLFPLDDALCLKVLLKDQENIYEIAYALIDAFSNDGEAAFEPDNLARLINSCLKLSSRERLQSISQRGMATANNLKKLYSSFESAPRQILNDQLAIELDDSLRQDFIPLITAFIRMPEKKRALIESSKNSDLLSIVASNKESLISLQDESDFDSKLKHLQKICQALDPNTSYKTEDFFNVVEHISSNANTLSLELKKLMLAEYMLSDEFFKLLHFFYNKKDVMDIRKVLHQPHADFPTIAHFASDKLFAGEQDFSQVELLLKSVISLIQAEVKVPDLSNVENLFDRLKVAQQFFMNLLDIDTGVSCHLDVTHLNQTLKSVLMPLFKHPEFNSFVCKTLGFLDCYELEVILCAHYNLPTFFEEKSLNSKQSEIRHEAEHLFQFVQALKNNQDDALFDLIRIPQNDQGFVNIKSVPLQTIFSALVAVLINLKDVHCYFNQHNEKGITGASLANTNFISRLTDQVNTLRVPLDMGNFYTETARRLFFVQGIRKGLPGASAMAAQRVQATIKRLQRVNKHILRPLLWTNNISRVRLEINKFFKDCYYYLFKANLYRISNLFKTLYNLISSIFNNDPELLLSLKHLDKQSMSYNNDSFSYARVLNQLHPLSAADILKDPDRQDVIEHLEKMVDRDQFTCQSDSEATSELDDNHVSTQYREVSLLI